MRAIPESMDAPTVGAIDRRLDGIEASEGVTILSVAAPRRDRDPARQGLRRQRLGPRQSAAAARQRQRHSDRVAALPHRLPRRPDVPRRVPRPRRAGDGSGPARQALPSRRTAPARCGRTSVAQAVPRCVASRGGPLARRAPDRTGAAHGADDASRQDGGVSASSQRFHRRRPPSSGGTMRSITEAAEASRDGGSRPTSASAVRQRASISWPSITFERVVAR